MNEMIDFDLCGLGMLVAGKENILLKHIIILLAIKNDVRRAKLGVFNLKISTVLCDASFADDMQIQLSLITLIHLHLSCA